ncbi:ATP-binding cassette domain-containing protein [Ottowia sp.]|uniref:ATP-binding cassette domain-containing protein n=1 Tax=Ottowia sp. TaxID=1898956 RepID=UPI003A876572
MSTPPIIEINHLTYDYPDLRALRHISTTIPRHSVTALVGPNGAGKTTLLRCIAGLETPVAGEVVVGGLSVRKHPRQVHRIMGYLPDHFGLYSDLTVQQCLQYAARSQGLAFSAVDDAVQHTLARLKLSDKLHHRAGNASGWRLASPSFTSPKCCCWTNRPAGWTRRRVPIWRSYSHNCDKTA